MVDDPLSASMDAGIDAQRVLHRVNQMRSGPTAGVTIYSGSIAAFTLVFIFFFNGCATHDPHSSISIPKASRILFIAPRYDPSLHLEVSAWAALVSENELRDEQLIINAALSPWTQKVVDKFSSTLIETLQGKGYRIDNASSEDRTSIARKSASEVEIRSYLTAGFVYKTLTSRTYVPFVMVVLEARSNDDRIIYQQLFAATDRSFNPLMNRLPAATQYTFSDLNSLRASPADALEALSSLAVELGKKYAADLSIGPQQGQ